MKPFIRFAAGIAVFCGVAGVARQAAGQHAGDFLVGRTAAGQLVVAGPVGQVVRVNPVSGPLLWGWTAGSPGFDVPLMDMPEEDFYRLASGASVYLEVTEIETGVKLWQAGLGGLADEPGERIYLGGSSLHSHPIWHIDSTVAPIDPTWQGGLTATVKLVDRGSTKYGDSEAFVLLLKNTIQPIRPSPCDGQSGVPRRVDLSWNDDQAEVGVVYDVYLDTVDPPIQQLAADLQVSRYSCSMLVGGTTYFWKVVAKSGGQVAEASWSFRTATSGDVNGDGYVNVGDLQVLAAAWGQGPGYNGSEDINGDGYVNVGDLQVLIAQWDQP